MLPALDNSPPQCLQILLTARQLFVIRQTLSRKGRWEPIHAEAPRQAMQGVGGQAPSQPGTPGRESEEDRAFPLAAAFLQLCKQEA